ncbi:MAG: LamG domain-containing protein [Bacteroidales bacterium]|nr:LamG domain-containing protein [Bacteroidales bacterium]
MNIGNQFLSQVLFFDKKDCKLSGCPFLIGNPKVINSTHELFNFGSVFKSLFHKVLLMFFILFLASCEQNEIGVQNNHYENDIANKLKSSTTVPIVVPESSKLDVTENYAIAFSDTFKLHFENKHGAGEFGVFKQNVLDNLNFTEVEFMDFGMANCNDTVRRIKIVHEASMKKHDILVNVSDKDVANKYSIYLNVNNFLTTDSYERLMYVIEKGVIQGVFNVAESKDFDIWVIDSANAYNPALAARYDCDNCGDAPVVASTVSPKLFKINKVDVENLEEVNFDEGDWRKERMFNKSMLYYNYGAVDLQNNLALQMFENKAFNTDGGNNQSLVPSGQAVLRSYRGHDYITFNNPSSFTYRDGFTLSAEIKPDDFGTHRVFISKVSPNRDFVFKLYYNYVEVHFAHASPLRYFTANFKLDSLPLDFIKVTATWDGTSLSIYQDNVLMKSVDYTGFEPKWTGGQFCIGNLLYGSGEGYKGDIRNVHIFNKALKDYEIASIDWIN